MEVRSRVMLWRLNRWTCCKYSSVAMGVKSVMTWSPHWGRVVTWRINSERQVSVEAQVGHW
eukprot:6491019-Amphidinium_carterae.6